MDYPTVLSTNAFEARIDTKLADLWAREQRLYDERDSARASLASALSVRGEYVGRRRVIRETWEELVALADTKNLTRMDEDRVAYARENRAKADAGIATVRAEAEPLEAIYEERKWPRFFLVTNSNGHIHESMHCATCFVTTRFAWLPELSGLTEKDAVEAYGPKLCSVCYPTAPVEWTLGVAKPVDPDRCEGSGTWDHDSSGLRYYSPRARCNHCGRTVSVTSTGKMRKHKVTA